MSDTRNMAKKKVSKKKVSKKKVTAKTPGTEIANWDEELAKAAELASAAEANSGGGEYFSTSGGVLTWQDNPLPNNTMGVIILSSIFEYTLYDGPYVKGEPRPPTCFALGEHELELKPHENVVALGQEQNDDCKTCQWNQWGSADVGKGKACKNSRRLAMLPAGTFDKAGNFEQFEDAEHYEDSTIGFLKLPVTSTTAFAAYVKQLAGTLKRPPFAMFTQISLVPDAKTQFKVTFEALDKVPDELLQIVMSRRDEGNVLIDSPYSLEQNEEEEEEEPAPRSKKKVSKKKVSKKKVSKKKRY